MIGHISFGKKAIKNTLNLSKENDVFMAYYAISYNTLVSCLYLVYQRKYKFSTYCIEKALNHFFEIIRTQNHNYYKNYGSNFWRSLHLLGGIFIIILLVSKLLGLNELILKLIKRNNTLYLHRSLFLFR